jgi:hypothetical protein
MQYAHGMQPADIFKNGAQNSTKMIEIWIPFEAENPKLNPNRSCDLVLKKNSGITATVQQHNYVPTNRQGPTA